MADVSDFVQALQRNLIAPLERLPLTQLKALDMLHDQSVQDFQAIIGQLYASSGPFTGQTADALADLLADYYTAEHVLSAYTGDGLSERIGKLIQFCQQVVADLKPQLQALQEGDPFKAAGTTLAAGETGAAVGPDETPAVPLVQLVLVAAIGTIFLSAQARQEWQVWQAFDTMHYWEMNMNGLAQYQESRLPPGPTAFTQGVGSDLPDIPFQLNGQVITVGEGDIASELFDEFGGVVSMADILDILANNPGLTKDEYRFLVDYYRRYGKKPYHVVAVLPEWIKTGKRGYTLSHRGRSIM